MSDLLTAQEIERELGKAYFYRQRMYRMVDSGELPSYTVKGTLYFNRTDVISLLLNQLEKRIESRFSHMDTSMLRASYDQKQVKVEGFLEGRSAYVDTEVETEVELLEKIENIGKEVITMAAKPELHKPAPPPHGHHPHPHPHHEPEPKRHHRDVMDALRRIEDRLTKIEEKFR